MKKYWSSLKEYQDVRRIGKPDGLEGTEDTVFELPEEGLSGHTSSRRDFLRLLGFSTSAAILAGCKKPVQMAIPYVIQPEEIVPGKALYYATSFSDGRDFCNILVKTRDGRPIKIEPNPVSLFNGKATTARIQASVLSLYDDARLKQPSENGAPVSWDQADERIMKGISAINSEGGKIVLLTSNIVSPSTKKLINEFGSSISNFEWISYEPVSYSGIREANRRCFGIAAVPDYNFQNADVIVSFNADFLGSWIMPVHFIPKYTSRRKIISGQENLLRHIQLEPGMSITGSNADLRIKIKPSEEKNLLIDLYNRIAQNTGNPVFSGSPVNHDLNAISNELLAAKGRLVISGSNDPDIQVIVNGINLMLGSYANCIDINNPLNIGTSDSAMDELTAELGAGNIKALLMYNVNPVYDYPLPEKFAEGLRKTSLSVCMNVALNETTTIARFVCPVSHYLESWDDAEILPGHVSLVQPCISPIFNTRLFQDSLLKWSGKQESYYDYLRSNWEMEFLPVSGKSGFNAFWTESLSKGVFNFQPRGSARAFNIEVIANAMVPSRNAENNYEVVLYESVTLGDGKYANNPWLMELPDPVTRASWDNIASISVEDAEELGINTGDIISIGDGITIPAYVQPGQAAKTISVAFGYGHSNNGKVADNIGVNVFPHFRPLNGFRSYWFSSAAPVKTGQVNELALVQTFNYQEGRPIVRETTIENFRKDPKSGNEMHFEFQDNLHDRNLYPDPEFKGFHWGMCIDLNLCIGCNTCVIACQAENNIPVVGKNEVRLRRIMHWMKIDRYYSGDPSNPQVIYQPVTCQHCDNAPCENVCPVSATNHSSEGLNQMAYTRCIGTKYCINNCPYKVRRFNWYKYTNNKEFDYLTTSDLGRMVLNPDVTVRERGIVEKCTFCVQRIQERKLEAKLENRPISDGEIQPACAQACPAGAIIFGNLKDEKSEVSKLFSQPRRYHLLEELHTLPSLGYLTKVWNRKNV